MKISIVVAVSQNNVIGNEGKLPWQNISSDMRRFRKITEDHHVLMGRKTFDSIIDVIGRPLPKRTSLVLSRQKLSLPEGCFSFNDFESAVNFARSRGEEELMVIGGQQIYKHAIERADRIYLTRVLGEYEGDTFFPKLNEDTWCVLQHEIHSGNSEPSYEFRRLERKG